MQNPTMKFIDASQAYSIVKYTNTKRKLLNCNANIYFNKACLRHNITPKYAQVHIKTANTSKAAKHTETQTRLLRIKNEVKFLYKKKQQLNKDLYRLHIKSANEWGNTWYIISQNVTDTLEITMKSKYNNITKKIHRLINEQKGDAHPNTNSFHKRVENLTDITFTSEETQLLSKGLKYNLHHKQSNWVKTLAIEADTAINRLDPTEQAFMRQAVANKLKTLINHEETQKERKVTHETKQQIHEKKLINSIKKKMKENNLAVTKADKGNTLIVMHQDEYNQKVDEFITQNNFTKLTRDQTNTQQKAVRTAINTCSNTIKHSDKWKYVNMNPEAPHIHGTPTRYHSHEITRRTNTPDRTVLHPQTHLNTLPK
jgi:quinol monooxygenase YgiN